MALPGDALVTLIVDAGALEAHQGEHAPEEDVDFPKIRELLQGPAGHQTIVGVVKNRVRPHPFHELVEAFGGEALEEGVGFPLAADAVDDLRPGQVFVNHCIHGIYVVLPVAVDGNGDIAFAPGFHQACQQRVLVAPVPAQADAFVVFILFGKLANEIPGAIFATVVDEQHPAVRADFPL